MPLPARRSLVLLLALLCLGAALTAVTVATPAPAGAAVRTDPRLGPGACALVGRKYVAGAGCARRQCVAGASIAKAGFDAEVCERRGPKGASYAQPISKDRCGRLGRIWVGQVNSCASNPDRSRRVVPGAAPCRSRSATYVNHDEEEGSYDECLSPAKVRELTRVAKQQRVSLNRVALDRGRANCSFRGGWVMVDGVCERRQGPPPADQLGGTLVVGDSVSWRADDELTPRRPDWTFDLRPGRRLDELPGRLDWFRADHGQPTRLIVQLGTNRRKGYGEQAFRATMATVPPTTPVLFMLPFREPNGTNAGPVNATKKYTAWMRSLAADRPGTCLAEWPTHASKNLDHLVDGEHPASRYEGWYARYLLRSWERCADQLGL